MDQSEFTALQVTILIRTRPGGAGEVRGFLDSVPFQYQFQDSLGDSIKQSLKSAGVPFEEAIITLDNPATKAEKVRSKSAIARLFGKK
jgi:hypothetical protein